MTEHVRVPAFDPIPNVQPSLACIDARCILAASLPISRRLLQADEAVTFPLCNSLETAIKTTVSGEVQASYGHNANCMWMLQTGMDTVTAEFSAFETEMGYDFVRIYDGPTANPNALLTMLTGKTIPQPVTATSGTMLIVLSSDVSVAGSGFALTWTSSELTQSTVAAAVTSGVAEQCSGNINLATGDGTLTDGSGNYKNNAGCSWAITSATGRYITLSFSALDLEDQYDYVRVYDEFDGSTTNPHGTGLLLGSYTGRNLPASVTSTTGHMFVVLASDSSVVSSGFVASYTTDANAPTVIGAGGRSAPSSSTGYVAPIYAASNGPCSGTARLMAASGSFSTGSVLGSNLYGSNAECNWEIQPSVPNAVITLTFNSFATEYVYDHVQVYDGSRLIGQYSGFNNPGTLTATSGSMTVIFDTDGSVEHGGFTAQYTVTQGSGAVNPINNIYPEPANTVVVPQQQLPVVTIPGVPSACQQIQRLTSTRGSFSSGSTYIDNANCRWLINAGAGAQVQLQFRRFEMEDFYDWVWVYDGPNDSAPLAGKYSGSSLPPVMTATSGMMFVKLTSDSSIHLGGFDAFYSVMSAEEANSRRIQPSP